MVRNELNCSTRLQHVPPMCRSGVGPCGPPGAKGWLPEGRAGAPAFRRSKSNPASISDMAASRACTGAAGCACGASVAARGRSMGRGQLPRQPLERSCGSCTGNSEAPQERRRRRDGGHGVGGWSWTLPHPIVAVHLGIPTSAEVATALYQIVLAVLYPRTEAAKAKWLRWRDVIVN